MWTGSEAANAFDQSEWEKKNSKQRLDYLRSTPGMSDFIPTNAGTGMEQTNKQIMRGRNNWWDQVLQSAVAGSGNIPHIRFPELPGVAPWDSSIRSQIENQMDFATQNFTGDPSAFRQPNQMTTDQWQGVLKSATPFDDVKRYLNPGMNLNANGDAVDASGMPLKDQSHVRTLRDADPYTKQQMYQQDPNWYMRNFRRF